MRHANVQTTMQYYVDLDVDDMADALWANHPAEGGERTAGNTGPESTEAVDCPDAVTASVGGTC